MKFGVFGTVGTRDFNYYEMRQLDAQLAKLAVPHRVEVWEGEHAWPPVALAAQAVEWLDLQAMKRGVLPPDPALIESLLRARQGRGSRTRGGRPAGRRASSRGPRSRPTSTGFATSPRRAPAIERLRKPAAEELKRRDKLDNRSIDAQPAGERDPGDDPLG